MESQSKMDEEITSLNFKNLLDRLNDLDDDQLKLIHEELVELCDAYKESNDINDVVNEVFTCRLDEMPQKFRNMVNLDSAIEHVKTLPKINVHVDYVPAMVRHFLDTLLRKNENLGEVVVYSCNKLNGGSEVFQLYLHKEFEAKTYTFLVGTTSAYVELLTYLYNNDDEVLGSVVPSMVRHHMFANCCRKPSEDDFDSLVGDMYNVKRANLYRMLLSSEALKALANEVIENDIEGCFGAVRGAVKFTNGNRDYVYLQTSIELY